MATSQQTSNRSEVIRQRRSNRTSRSSAAPLSKRPVKTSGPTQPPLLMRSSLAGTFAPDARRGKKTKRRYDVALGTQGVEMQRPSLPKIAIGWRLVSGLVVGVLLFVLYTLWNFPALKVSAAEVEGLQNLKPEDINAIAAVSGKPIFLVKPGEIQEELQAAFPDLASVTVQVKIPAQVFVSVEERVPVLNWKQEGRNFWVDAEGVAFPERNAKSPKIVVEAEGALPASADPGEGESAQSTVYPVVSPELVSAVQAMAEEAPKDIPLVYSSERGLGWKDPRGWQVFFGKDTQDMAAKLSIYQAIVKSLKKDDIKPAVISVEYLYAPYYRLER
jgi:cell division protein FtsQ